MGDLWMWLQLMWLQFEVVRSPVGVNSGPVGGPLAPKPSHLDPKQSQPDHGQPQIADTRVVAKSIDRRTKGLSSNETVQATLCNGSKQHGEYDKPLPMSVLWMWLQLMCPIKAIRRIRQTPANERSMDVAATHVSDQSNTANTTKIVPMGDLWMWLQVMWLQFEVVGSPVAVNSGPVGTPLAPKSSQLDPKQSQPDHGQPQSAATRIVAKSIDRRTMDLRG
jgi:hypothetical protein